MPSPVASRVNVTPYRPDGGFEPAGLGMLFSAMALAGAALGFAAHFVSQAFYLILIFPIVIGLALGWLGRKMVRQGRVRNPWIGATAGFLGGAFAMLMMHYFDYEKFKREMAKLLPEVAEVAALDEPARREFAADFEEPEFLVMALDAYRSFPAYMHLEATEGVTIGRASSTSPDRGLNLGYVGSWIYWGVEVLIVAGITLFMVKDETAKPYCPTCGQWKAARPLGGITGDAAAATAGVNGGDLAAIAQAAPTAEPAPVMVFASLCPTCQGAQSPADVRLAHFVTNNNGKVDEKTLAHASWPAEAMPALSAVFAAPAPTPPPVPAAAAPATQPV